MVKLRFCGFDIPGLAAGIASPAQVLHFVRLRRRTSLQSCGHAVPN
jgi:hypothetical protein